MEAMRIGPRIVMMMKDFFLTLDKYSLFMMISVLFMA